MAARGGLYFPIKLRCTEASGVRGNPQLSEALVRALSRSFARAQAALPAPISTGDGVCLHPPVMNGSSLSPDEETRLLALVSRAIAEAAQAQSLPAVPMSKPASLRHAPAAEKPWPDTKTESTGDISEQFDPDRYDPDTASYEIPSYHGGKRKVPVRPKSKHNPFKKLIEMYGDAISSIAELHDLASEVLPQNDNWINALAKLLNLTYALEFRRGAVEVLKRLYLGEMSPSQLTAYDKQRLQPFSVRLMLKGLPNEKGIADAENEIQIGLILVAAIRAQLFEVKTRLKTLTRPDEELLRNAILDLGSYYLEVMTLEQGKAEARLSFLQAFYRDEELVSTYAVIQYASKKLPEVWDRLLQTSVAPINRWGSIPPNLHLGDQPFLESPGIQKALRSGVPHLLALARTIDLAQLIHREIDGVTYLPKDQQEARKVPDKNLGSLVAAQITHLQVSVAVLELWAPIATIRDLLLELSMDAGEFEGRMSALEKSFAAELQRYPHADTIQDDVEAWRRQVNSLLDDFRSSAKWTQIKRLIIGEIPFLIMGAGIGESVNLVVRGPRWVVLLAQAGAMTVFNLAAHPPGPGQQLTVTRVLREFALNLALSWIGQIFHTLGEVPASAEAMVSTRRLVLNAALKGGGAFAATTLVQTAFQAIEARASAAGGESSFTEMLTLNSIMNLLGILCGAALHSEAAGPGAKNLARSSPDELARRAGIDVKAANDWLDLANRSQEFVDNYKELSGDAKAGKLTKQKFDQWKEKGKKLVKELGDKLPGLAKILGSTQTPEQIKSILAKIGARIDSLSFEEAVLLLPEFTPGLTHVGDGPTWTYDPAGSPKALEALKKSYLDRGMSVEPLPGGGWEVTDAQGRVIFQALPARASVRAALPPSLDAVAKGARTEEGLARVRAQTAVPELPAQLAEAAATRRGANSVRRLLQMIARGDGPPKDSAFRGISNYLKLGGNAETLIRAITVAGDRTGANAAGILSDIARWDAAAVEGLETIIKVRPRTTGPQFSELLKTFDSGEVVSILHKVTTVRKVTTESSMRIVVGKLMVERPVPERWRPGQMFESTLQRSGAGTLDAAVELIKRFPGKFLLFEEPGVTPGGVLRIEDIVIVEPSTGERILGVEVKEVTSAFLGRRARHELAADIVRDYAARLQAKKIGVNRNPYETFLWLIRKFEIATGATKRLEGRGVANPTPAKIDAEMRAMVRDSLNAAFNEPEVKSLPPDVFKEYRDLFDKSVEFVEFF
jgi:hypothetical protein